MFHKFIINLVSKSQAICYRVECDTTKKQLIIHIGSSTLNCPTTGGNITVSGFKGFIDCPKYIDICSAKNNKLCNDMFNCLEQKSTTDEDTYSYYILQEFFFQV